MKKIICLLLCLLVCKLTITAQDNDKSKYRLEMLNIMQMNNDIKQRIINEGDLSYLNCSFDFINLSILSKSDLRILRNTIFAVHGLIFKSTDLNEHFRKFLWYKPKYNDVNDQLTQYDKYNIEQIQEFEKSSTSLDIVPSKVLIGVWSETAIMPSGWPERFMIYTDGSCIFGYSTMQQLPGIKYLYGHYKINKNQLEISWNKRTVFDHSNDVVYSGGFGYEWSEIKEKDEELSQEFNSEFTIDYLGEQEISKSVFREVLSISGKNFYKFNDEPNEGLKL
jgi:hypothetical protein